MPYNPNVVPRLYIKSQGEQTTKLALQLTTAKRKTVVRFTGGCGKMSDQDAANLLDLFTRAFIGYDGAAIYGGTRMLRRDDPTESVMGITEVPSHLRSLCPDMVLLGVVPRTQDLGLCEQGMIVANDANDPYFTIVHPEQDITLVVQVSADNPEVWDAEYQECMRITNDLKEYCNFKSILISYNGGSVTEREILRTAEKGWPVILIKDSGRKTDEYANNREFLALRTNVRVVEKDAASLRAALVEFGAVPERRLHIVKTA